MRESRRPLWRSSTGSRAHTPRPAPERREAHDAGAFPGSRSTDCDHMASVARLSQDGEERGALLRYRAEPDRSSLAQIGLMLEHGGHAGTVVELTESAAVVVVGALDCRCPSARKCGCRDHRGSSCRPQRVRRYSDPAEKYETALREWRSEAAKQASVPAYVVLNDGELAGIAARRPTTMAELARCKGIGPTRLERWGDELLSALDGADV